MSALSRSNHLGSLTTEKVHHNLAPARLVELAIMRGEGFLTESGAFRAETGRHTGRSPKDKYLVRDPDYEDVIWWGPINQPVEPEIFNRLLKKVRSYLQSRELFVFDGFAGADPEYRLPVRIINELAWHNLFAHQLFVRPSSELEQQDGGFTVLSAPTFQADPEVDGTRSDAFVMLSFDQKVVLIGGTHYAGEIKKSIFTVMNYLMPQRGVLPMHCSANIGPDDEAALFFGLSGTGKTTLSADPGRRLIGDDEHGWSERGIFNFEGGCYAKCIHLSKNKEPQIWEAIRFGSVLENVVVDEQTRKSDFKDEQITENTRAAYPVDYIPGAVLSGMGSHPRTILFLTADAFGVLPPISRLNGAQAMYHFISGYTSKLAGTEAGVTEPEATFSACFGAPFLPLHPGRYAKMLGNKIEEHRTRVYLVNTGWTGGPYGLGERVDLRYTRAMVSAALSHELEDASFSEHPIFKVEIPDSCPNVPSELLNPRNTWADERNYDEKARELARRFEQNFRKFDDVASEISEAGPRI